MSARWKRRAVRGAVALVVLGLGLWLAAPWILSRIAGASSRAPEEIAAGLSPAARELLDDAWEGIDPAQVVDVHTHVAGLGAGGTGCRVHPEMRSWAHPWKHIQFLAYAHAARIEDLEQGDAQFVERLLALIRAGDHRGRRGKHGLLAFDLHHRADGTPDEQRSEMYVPNDYVLELAARHPDAFAPVISVHPYRADAVAELERCAARGARLCKWLPNAMGIDPADPRCDPFYAALARTRVALLTHTGEERAVDAEGAQELGNPLRLRRALERGVTVILAHCASLGESLDLDQPGQPPTSSFELFLRLMGEERWEGRLYGELSAVVLANRDPAVVEALLARSDLHERLVNGSDYPLPAIRAVWSTRAYVARGLLSAEQAAALEEIYDFNPLVFDFALKRTLRHPLTQSRFEPVVFTSRARLGL